jgi:predicted enzyme related to lactoylglutathione lyase
VVDPAGVGPRGAFSARAGREDREESGAPRRQRRAEDRAPAQRSEEDWRRVEEHVRTLAAAGATALREVNEVNGRCVVMQDPEGNEFCVH